MQASNTATSTGVSENAEFQALATEIGNIGARTKFAGKAVFSATALTFQVGAQRRRDRQRDHGLMLGATSVTGFDDTSPATASCHDGT